MFRKNDSSSLSANDISSKNESLTPNVAADYLVILSADGVLRKTLMVRGHDLRVRSVSANTTVAITDDVILSSAAAVVANVAALVAQTGKPVYFKNNDTANALANTLTLSGATINGANSLVLSISQESVMVVSDGATLHAF